MSHVASLLVARVAGDLSLDSRLLHALVKVESGGQAWAWNPEPRYRYLWDVRSWRPFRALTSQEIAAATPPADFGTLAGDRDQEWWGQRASWGLCQVMGAVARERGVRVSYLPALLEPELNLYVGGGHLKDLLAWADGNMVQALAAYNGGRVGNSRPPFRNVTYAQKVLDAMGESGFV